MNTTSLANANAREILAGGLLGQPDVVVDAATRSAADPRGGIFLSPMRKIIPPLTN